MLPEPNNISREDFERLKQLRVDFEAGPLHPVPTSSPQPPQLEVHAKEPLQTLTRKPESPSHRWKEGWRDLSGAAIYALPLLGLFQAVTAPKEFHLFLTVTDSFFAAFYKSIYSIHVVLVKFIGSLQHLTKLPNLNVLLFGLIMVLSFVCYLHVLAAFFMSGSYLVDNAGKKWSKSLKSWIASIPSLIFFGPLLGWLAIHLFVIFIVDPVVWLLAPHR